jgi:hypothetical protein
MFGADTRGQAIQIGAVVLFSFAVLTFSLYQATIVPDNNAEVEFNHNDQVQQDLAQLRAAVLTAATTRGGYPVPVDLGPRYPPRVVAVNPGPPSGTLTTVSYGTGQLTVANVRATDAEVRDYWSGSMSYETNGVEFRPNYNVYAEAPTTVYENSVLYNVFDSPAASGPATVDGETVRLSSDQTLVDGKRIDLVALVGERQDSTTETVSVDPTATTVPSRTVTVQGDSGPITVSLPTNLDVNAWRALLKDEYVSNGGYVEAGTVSVSSGAVSFDLVETEKGTPVIYQLRVPAVGVDSSLSSSVAPVPTYTVAESARTVTASPGESVRLTTGVANQYNGPESGVTVEASAGGSTVDTAVTDADGKAVVTYTAPSSPGSYTVTVEADFDADGMFGEDSTETVTFTVDVTGSGGGGGDGIPPGVSGLSATPDPLTQGDDLNLAATFDDIAGRGGSDIISASWSDARSGDSGSLGAVDGEFDQPTEDVETTIDGSVTSGWTTGDHDITITGTDANGNTVSQTVTVAVQSAAGGPSFITAVEPDPQALADSDGEFIRLQIPSGVNTTGWELREGDGSTAVTQNFDGEVYLVRDENAFENQWPVDPTKVFQYDSTIVLDNAGQTVELVDDIGTVVDRFSHGDGDGSSFSDRSRYTFSGGTDGQVAVRTQSGGSFDDTDSASDWTQSDECTFFGGGNGCGGRGGGSPTADGNGPYGPLDESETAGLDGTGSSAPDGDSLTYSWTITSDPTGDASLTDPDTATPTFNAPGDFEGTQDVTVELTVEDPDGNSDTDSTTVTLSEGEYDVVWGDPVTDSVSTGGSSCSLPCTATVPFRITTTTAAGDDETVSVSSSDTGVAQPASSSVTTDGSGNAVVGVSLGTSTGVADLTISADGNGVSTSDTTVVDTEFVEQFDGGYGRFTAFGGGVSVGDNGNDDANSGSTSVRIDGHSGPAGIETAEYDMSGADVIVVDFWAQEGGNGGSDDDPDGIGDPENPEPGDQLEELRLEYYDANGNWVTVDYAEGNRDPNDINEFERRAIIDAADARHPNFRIRLVQKTATASDVWYIDDVRMTMIGTSTSPELPSNADAYDDANGNGQYDSGETTYSASELYDFDRSVNLVISSDAGGGTLSTTESIDIKANEITSDVDMEAESIKLSGGNGPGAVDVAATRLESTSGSVELLGRSITATDTVVRADGGSVTLNAEQGSGGPIDIDGADISTVGGNSVTIKAVSVSARNVRVVVPGSSITIEATVGGGGEIDASGGRLETTGGNEINLKSKGDVFLNDTATQQAKIEAANSAATVEVGRGSNTLHVDGVEIVDADDTLNLSPNGANVDGTPESGSVS